MFKKWKFSILGLGVLFFFSFSIWQTGVKRTSDHLVRNLRVVAVLREIPSL